MTDATKEKVGHTPGPWSVSNEIGGIGRVIGLGRTMDDRHWYVHASTTIPDSEVPANAHLIAAAPALYNAIIARAKAEAREYDDGEHEWRAYLTEAEAEAIAKAEGADDA